MARFKVGDRVRLVSYENDHLGLIYGDLGTVAEDSTVPFVDWDRVSDKWAVLESEIELAAVATATAALKEGDRVRFTDKVPDWWWFKSGQTGTVLPPRSGGHYTYDVRVDDSTAPYPAHVNAEHIELLPAEEPSPTPTPIAETLGVDLNPPAPPQVGDDVLIFGTIAGITHSPRGTNYNIVFETQNRRMSLHFLEEDFIVVDDEGDCPCANDNGPVPSTDTAKAFDAMGTWLRSLAVARAA